jgi:hypothetical protein
MADYNGLERKLAKLLEKHPKLRNFIKLVYQRIMYIIANLNKSNEYKNMAEVKVVTSQVEHFFGYYDKSPWDITNRYMLTLRVPFADKHPQQGDKATIGVIDTKNDNKFTSIEETNTWNLQQGSMLQWLGSDFNESIIYNDLNNNEYVSIIYNLKNKTKEILERPVYSVNKDGKFALSLNFSRLHKLRPGYGYANLEDKTKGQSHPEDDGIWYLDLESNQSKLIISLADIVKINWNEKMKDAQHWFNHIDISPNGTRFSFLHRWEYNNVINSRLYTADIDGKNIYCLADDTMVSHSCWKNNEQILVWCRQFDIGDRYYLLTDQTSKREVIGDGILNVDGHPSYSPDGRYILTDTYPDRTRKRSLIVYDTQNNERYDIAKVFAPFKYDGEIRCDLHPRWSRDGKQICFDSVHEGKRQLYVIDNPLINKVGDN